MQTANPANADPADADPAAGAASTPDMDPRARIVKAALPNVPFDGWSEATLRAAIAATDTAPALGHALFPRGAVDLALAFHRAGDAAMAERLAAADLSTMRYSDRVAFAIRTRLDVVENRELVRRGTTLFALPQHSADGARAIWGTADAIWRALGDSSTDINFYSKRATLSAVYAATVLYWLGDDSIGAVDTTEFIDRRIANVMQIEKLKSAVRDNPVARAVREGPLGRAAAAMDRFRPKAPKMPPDLPGRMRP